MPQAVARGIMEFIFGLIILVLDIYAIVRIIGSSASTGAKIVWVLLILILPLVGLLIWWLAGPKDRAGAGV